MVNVSEDRAVTFTTSTFVPSSRVQRKKSGEDGLGKSAPLPVWTVSDVAEFVMSLASVVAALLV